MSVIDIDESTFDEVVNSTDELVIVEFYLANCPVCAQVAPIFEMLSNELKQDAIFGRVDAQSNLQLSLRFEVVGTPTFKFFCKDKLIGEVIGGINETMFRNTVKDMIQHKLACASQEKKSSFEMDGYG